MKNKKKESELRVRTEIIKRAKILELLSVVTNNILQEVELLHATAFSKNISDEDVLFEKINTRNDSYSQAIYNLLLEDIFLPVKKHDLLLVYEAFEDLMDKTQRLTHRIGLITIPEWIESHLNEMLLYLQQILKLLVNWLDVDQLHISTITLSEVQSIENQADFCHQSFLHKLYAENLHYKVFKQAEFLDLIVEESVDIAERLAHRLYTILLEYQSSNEIATYLS